MITPDCHYCPRPATWQVEVHLRFTTPPLVDAQPLCDAHEAILSALDSTRILSRTAIELERSPSPTVILGGDATDERRPRRWLRDLLRPERVG